MGKDSLFSESSYWLIPYWSLDYIKHTTFVVSEKQEKTKEHQRKPVCFVLFSLVFFGFS